MTDASSQTTGSGPTPNNVRSSPPEVHVPHRLIPQIIFGLEILGQALIRTTIICLVLYGLYRIKSAFGINLSQHYHAIDLFTDPIQVITDILHA